MSSKQNKPVSTTPDVRLFDEVKFNRLFSTLQQFHDPDETLKKIGGRDALKQLLYDDAIFGAFETRFDSIKGLNFTLDGDNELINDFVSRALDEDCIDRLITGAMKAVAFGFNCSELVWSRQGSEIHVDRVINRSCKHFKISDSFQVFEATDSFNFQETIFGKFVLTQHRASSEQPYGEAILSRLYFAHLFRTHGWEFYIKFLEKYGHPLLHATLNSDKVDPITGRSSKEIFADALNAQKRPSAIVTGPDDTVNVFNPSNSGSQFKDFIECVNKRIQIAILGQTLSSDNSNGGSNALGMVHNLVREDKSRSDKRMIEQTINKVIHFIGFYNEISEDQLPKFKFEDPKSLNTQRVERDTGLFGIGVRFSEKYIREQYDLEADDFELQVDDILSSLGFTDKQHAKDCYKFATLRPDDDSVRILEEVQADYADNAPLALSIEELQAAIDSSDTRIQLERNLAMLVGRGDNQFMDTVTEALYESQVRGYVDANSES